MGDLKPCGHYWKRMGDKQYCEDCGICEDEVSADQPAGERMGEAESKILSFIHWCKQKPENFYVGLDFLDEVEQFIRALKPDEKDECDDLTAAYMCGFHKRDEEVREKDRVIREMAEALEFYTQNEEVPDDLGTLLYVAAFEDRGHLAKSVLTKPENAAVIDKARGK